MILLANSVVRMFVRVLRLAVLGPLIMLAGCYPEYNWREMPMADGLLVAAFPAKVNAQSRALDLAGVTLDFHVTSARVDQNIFAVGYARLPVDTSVSQKQAVATAMTDSLAHSLGATVDQGGREGRPFIIRSQQGETPLLVVARVVEHRDLVVRMMASGPADALPEEMAMTFIESLSLR